MTDLHDIRAQLRDLKNQPAPIGGGSGGVAFWIVAACAAALGFSVVLFTPRIYSVQRTASLPTFQETRDRIEAGPALRPAFAPPASNPSRYAGKSSEEMGKIADGVCFQRAHALQPHWSKTPRLTTKELSDFVDIKEIKHFDALLHCLVTEAPARFCSGSQRNMIKAEIAMYFRGIEHANTATKSVVAELKGKWKGPEGIEANPDFQKLLSLTFAPDESVLAGIEGLMRAGYLTAAQRSDINVIAPRPIRERFARVVGSPSPCPKPPWWAVWR